MNPEIDRIRRLRLIQEAEGYLDLILVFADQWPAPPEMRDMLARRALDVLLRLEKIDVPCSELLYLRGQALRVMERYEEALAPLSAAAEQDPANIHIWLALAWCYKRTSRLDLAIESLEEAMAIDRGEAIVYYNLACYWSLAGNARLALDYLSEAFELDSNYRDMVDSETDFDSIRNDPNFLALTSVIV